MHKGQPDFLKQTLDLFPHPATGLWRAIEAREVWKEFVVNHHDEPSLDLGCGDGRFSLAAFVTRRFEIGLDISSSSLISAKRMSTYSDVVVGDGSKLPFRDGAFKTVLSNSVLEHVPNVSRLLTETHRVLKNEGTFVFTVPSPNFSRFLFVTSLFSKIPFLKSFGHYYADRRNSLLSHNNIASFEDWSGWLRSSGFLSVRGKSCLPKAALQVWDLMAIAIYFMRIPFRTHSKVLAFSMRSSKRVRVSIFARILRRLYLSVSSEGADLIIIAKANT